jgi:hypothetical protein
MLRMKRLGREAELSPLFSAKVKNMWSYNFTSSYAFMTWTGIYLHFYNLFI